MDIPWPLNTTFQIYSENGNELWIVSRESDPQKGFIGEGSGLGKSLLMCGEKRFGWFAKPDGKIFYYKIVSIKPPGSRENAFKTPIDFYLDTYRRNPRDIRNNPHVANVCLRCGHQNSATLPGEKKCEACATKWYRHRCWQCTKGSIDSRDPRTPRCSRCGYLRCAECSACLCGATLKKIDEV